MTNPDVNRNRLILLLSNYQGGIDELTHSHIQLEYVQAGDIRAFRLQWGFLLWSLNIPRPHREGTNYDAKRDEKPATKLK